MKFIRHFGILFSFLLAGVSLQAQTASAALNSVLDHTLDSMRTETKAKSLSAAIQFADGSIWAHAKGISSTFPALDVTTRDAYLIGSVTKTITSACILQLADAGVLNLDDSVSKWLPAMPYVDSNINIMQLMQHTSGLYDVLSHPHNQDSMLADISRIWTPEELISRFMGPELFRPGKGWSYSNTNYFLLGMIIKAATGNEYYTELRRRFFDPQGLSSFNIPSFEPTYTPVAHVWLDIDGDRITDDAHNFYMSYFSLNSSAGAAGGYFSTPTDCTKWMRKYMRGDLLSPAMMSMARTTVTAPGSQGGQYGLGQMKNQTDFLGYTAYGHGGDLAYHASSWYFPLLDASINVFTNDNDVNSWALIPVVRELLRTYTNNQALGIAATASNENTVEVKAYPNPFQSTFTIDINGAGTDAIDVALTDVTGKVIDVKADKQSNGKTTTIVLHGLEHLNSGIYFVTLKGDSGWSKTIKMIK